eukprot:TRINITY_DN4487_c0_g1_i1.p1 TRINITY_DN4487_c0_g1~~TRINITY_DN4487_c0_g1_i1.p1  ORF type:complete len:191 (-),score=31.50 TRINITY_DN4487_c0_g1_i1:144-716(-)
MAYKYRRLPFDEVAKTLAGTQVNLKLIPTPGSDQPAIAQLVAYNLVDVELLSAYEGPARLHLIPHVNAPTADLPVRKIHPAKHIKANLTLPTGYVLHDYLTEESNSHPTSSNPSPIPRFSKEDILRSTAMPAIAPSFGRGPHIFTDREYMSILYETDRETLRKLVPDVCQVNKENIVVLSWVKNWWIWIW